MERSTEIVTYECFVGGQWGPAAGGETFDSDDPYTGQVWAKIPRCGAADVDRAVAAANAALTRGEWADMHPTRRGQLLVRLADILDREADALARTEVRDNGKLYAEMRGQTGYIAQWYRYFGGLADKIEGAVLPIDKPDMFTYTTHVPVGVVAAITPWNSPLMLTAWKLAPGIALTTIDVGEAESVNLALTDVRSPEQLLEDAAEQQILARVRSTGTVYQDTGEVSLSINGQMVDRVQVDLGDRSEEVVTFSSLFEAEGTYTGEVRVSGDNYEDDNAFYFTVDVLPKIRVLVVNGEASENWFDDESHWFGLAVGGTATSPFDLQSIEPNALSAAALQQSDVAVLLNVGDLSNGQAEAVTAYVEQGGSLLIAPGDRVEPELFNRQFAEITPADLQRPGGSIDDYLVIADYDRRHPVLRPLVGDWTARFEGHWSMLARDDSDVLMQFDNTEPALVERDHGQGKVMLFASTLDLEWNNLALQGLYLPFVHETLRHLVQSDIRQRAYAVGDTINLDTQGSASSLSATDPSGAAIPLVDNSVFTATTPGFVTANIDGNNTRYAVNFLPEESNLTRVAPATLYDAVINPDTSPIQSREVQTAQMIEELERPQRMWWYILVLVMLLILAEAVIANRTYR